MQKSIIVRLGNDSNEELNDLMEKGWKYIASCPMPSSPSSDSPSGSISPTCLVILEK